MKSAFDYRRNLEIQCDCITDAFVNKADSSVCNKTFDKICKSLQSDFLPPIDRDDIAILSYALLRIFNCVCLFNENNVNVFKNEILNQLGLIKTIASELLGKRKTCVENIRRLSEKNIECERKIMLSKYNDKEYALILNCSIAEFLKYALVSYFKNL